MEDATNAPEIEPASDVEPLEAEADTEPTPETADAIADPGTESAPDEPAGEPVAEVTPEPASEPTVEPVATPTALTLDELVAEIAKSDEVAAEAAEPVAEDAPSGAEPETVPEAEAEALATEAEVVGDETAEAPEGPKPLLRRLWTQAPFWAVDFIWLALTVTSTIVLWRAPAATFADGPSYAILVLGGAAMAFIGLLTGVVVFLLARSRAGEDERTGLGLALATRALAWTAGGVALWWIGLLLLDMHHAGVIG